MSEDIFHCAGEPVDVLRRVSGELRGALGSFPQALERLAPPEVREVDAVADLNAARVWQGFCRVLRLAGNLDSLGGGAGMTSGDIVGLCRDVMERAGLPAELLGLEVSFRCARSSHIIAMDGPGLERLVLNLLSNAFKFTPAGGRVILEVRVEGDWVRLTMSDSGCGVGTAPEGLGLRACRCIARDHGGSLVLTSREGGGTAAVVSLPNRKGEQGMYEMELDGGFNHMLVGLSDALPKEAFAQKFFD